MAVTTITVFWDVKPCSMRKEYGISKENPASITYHDDGGNRLPLNTDILLPDYKTSHPRIQQSSRVCYDLQHKDQKRKTGWVPDFQNLNVWCSSFASISKTEKKMQ